ncbi:hypothetical protein [Methylovulum psychrotolerans]|uniref:Uncharacterized protein n=1 Tax=Methylovulum psychrotolerans TaxID=1704499 RepID=A0A2S5CG04_9GAMM|nr:hypothetical protein [Methylovulum psychrotolerans]POZ49672.1 hypothetical protein AADEFJLK_04553 [Methylovulum psychrotolerans]
MSSDKETYQNIDDVSTDAIESKLQAIAETLRLPQARATSRYASLERRLGELLLSEQRELNQYRDALKRLRREFGRVSDVAWAELLQERSVLLPEQSLAFSSAVSFLCEISITIAQNPNQREKLLESWRNDYSSPYVFRRIVARRMLQMERPNDKEIRQLAVRGREDDLYKDIIERLLTFPDAFVAYVEELCEFIVRICEERDTGDGKRGDPLVQWLNGKAGELAAMIHKAQHHGEPEPFFILYRSYEQNYYNVAARGLLLNCICHLRDPVVPILGQIFRRSPSEPPLRALSQLAGHYRSGAAFDQLLELARDMAQPNTLALLGYAIEDTYQKLRNGNTRPAQLDRVRTELKTLFAGYPILESIQPKLAKLLMESATRTPDEMARSIADNSADQIERQNFRHCSHIAPPLMRIITNHDEPVDKRVNAVRFLPKLFNHRTRFQQARTLFEIYKSSRQEPLKFREALFDALAGCGASRIGQELKTYLEQQRIDEPELENIIRSHWNTLFEDEMYELPEFFEPDDHR